MLWRAAATFRRAIGSANIGAFSDEELGALESEAKLFEDFAALKDVPYPRRKATIVLPTGVVSETEDGDSDSSWLTYRSADKDFAVDFFVNPARSSTTLSLAATLLEKRVGMNFDKLDLSGEEFDIEGSATMQDGARGLVIMQGRARDKDVIGHGIRTPARPPAGLVLPPLKALALPTAELPFPTRVSETPEERNWRIIVKTLSNLIESDFRRLNGFEYLSTQDCRGVKRDRARLRKTVSIVYATGRKPLEPAQPPGPQSLGKIYGSEQGSQLSVGCLKVSIVVPGAEASVGTLAAGNRSAATPLATAGIEVSAPTAPLKLNVLDQTRYGFKADERIATDQTERALLFIHGYNNSFEDAVQRAAQFAAASDYDGFIYVFSWPSQGRFSSYAADMDFAESSEPELVRFMKMILTGGTPVKLDVIAHSMGSQIFLRSLDGLRSVFDVRVGAARFDRLRFGQLIFAAPDVSAQLFERKIAQIRPFADRVTVYASANDGALDISGWVRGNLPRAGAIGSSGQPMYAPNVDVIDITGQLIPRYLVKRYYYATHSAYAYDVDVVEDIADILAQSARAKNARISPMSRARLALRGNRFTELPYTLEAAKGKVWWRLNFQGEPEKTIVDTVTKYVDDWLKPATPAPAATP